MPDDLEAALDRLYALPAAQFTAARDALARELRGAGRRAESDSVRGLRRPTAPAAAINQLARGAPDRVEALLEAADRLRAVQERLLAGDAGRDELRAATDAERHALGSLLAAAASLPEPPSAAALDKVRQTLQAAATDDAVREAIARGRLEREAEPAGAWGAVALPEDEDAAPAQKRGAGGRSTRPAGERGGSSRGATDSARERRAAQRVADLARARAAAADARHDLDAAERAASEAREALEIAARHAEQARAALMKAQSAEAAARESAQRSLRALKRAEAIAGDTADRVARLERPPD